MQTADVTLYYYITPNIRNSIYYLPSTNILFKDNEADSMGLRMETYFKNMLTAKLPSANDRYITLKARSFSIFDNYIDIPLTAMSNYNLKYPYITYMSIKPNTGKRQFFHVSNSRLYPDKLRLFVTADNWANYIGYCNISNIKVHRTNQQLNLDNDELYTTEDHAAYTNERIDYVSVLNRTITRDNLRLIAVIQYRSQQDFNTSVDRVELFRFNPSDILDKSSNLTRADIIKAAESLSTLYSVSIGATDKEADILKLYLFDTTFGSDVSTNNEAFNIVYNGKAKNILGYRVASNIIRYHVILKNTNLGFEPKYNDITRVVGNPGRKMGVGTYYNLMDIIPFVGVLSLEYDIISQIDGIQIVVKCGNNSKDITQAFELPYNKTGGSLTALEGLNKWIGLMANGASAGYQIAQGGIGVLSGAGQAIKTVTSAFTGDNGNNGVSLTQGGAFVTFDNILNNNSGDFFVLGRYGWDKDTPAVGHQEFDCLQQIFSNGALCNYQIPNTWIDEDITGRKGIFQLLSEAPYLIEGTTAKTKPTFKYIQAEVQVDYIPDEAASEIQARFNEGIRFKIIPE